jgi:hypothetical protein
MKIFCTTNLKLAAALVSAGFRIITHKDERGLDVFHVDEINQAGKKSVSVELEPEAHGVTADELKRAFENLSDLGIDDIIVRRGITPDEYCKIAFDAGRSAGHNRVAILFAGSKNQPLNVLEIGGRTLIYRTGMPKDELRRLVNA